MPTEFLNFLIGGAICALAGAAAFTVRKRWPDSTAVTVLSWLAFFVVFGGAIFFFGS